MDKIQIIEKLFSYLDFVTFSYLIIPLGYLLIKGSKKDLIPICMALYGLLCFSLLYVFEYHLPPSFQKYYYTFYTTFEYGVFAFIFFHNLEAKRFKKIVVFFSLAFLVFQVIYLFTAKKVRLDSVPIGIETILVFIYIFFFFYEFSRKPSGNYIYNHYCFWIAVGILIYLGGSFFFYILFNHLNEDEIKTFGNLTYTAELIKNFLFTGALFVYHKNPQKSKKEPSTVPYLDMI